jgi:tetratricopeptide (TPR) repeat protein
MEMRVTRVSLLAFMLVFAVFGSSLYYDFFIFDDATLIYRNDFVNDISWESAIGVWSKSNTPIITNLWQAISASFGTDSATPYRLVNILFHSINCFLVFWWCQSILSKLLEDTENRFSETLIQQASLVALVCFAIHPVQVESVVWASSLKEVFSATFGITSFIFYLKKLKEDKASYEVLTVIFFVLGVLTHPTIAALPLVYIWLDYALFKKSPREIFYRNGIYLLFLIAAVVIHKTVNPQLSPSDEQPLYIRISVALNALLSYLGKLAFPFTYSFDYMLTPELIAKSTKTALIPRLKAFFSGIGIWGLVLCYRHKNLRLIHFSLFTIIFLVSVNLGLIGYAFQNISTIADRFLYFPSIGAALSFALLHLWLSSSKVNLIQHLSKPLVYGALATMMVLTFQRVHLWRTSGSVLSASIKNGFESFPLHISLGVALAKEKQFEAAIQHFEKALAIANRRDSQGKKPEAASTYEAYAHMFDVYKESKDEARGLYLYQRIMSDGTFISAEMAWKIADYLIEIKKWYEATKYVEYMAARFVDSVQVLDARARLNKAKFEAVMDANLSLGINELDNGKHNDAEKYLSQALLMRKKLELNHDDIDKLIEINQNLKKLGKKIVK